MVSHFNFNFSDVTWYGTSFPMLICHLYILFALLYVKVFVPFFILFFFLIEFYGFLYILDNNLLSDVYFTNIFSHSIASGLYCLLIFLTSYFAKQKLLFYCSLAFSFMDCIFGVASKMLSPYPKSPRLSPMLSSKSFIILCFTFMSVVYFELIFVMSIMPVSRFIWMSSCSSTIYWKFSLVHCIIFISLSNISSLYLCRLIWGLTILYHCFIFLFFHQFHTVLITLAL